MELIVGGAFQGQLEYGKSQHPDISWIDGAACSLEELYQADGVYDFHEFIKSQLRQHGDCSHLAEDLIRENEKLVVVSNEVGYGVVPIDAFERAYREAVGRVCTKLAAHSHKVTRVICGIGTVIKDA